MLQAQGTLRPEDVAPNIEPFTFYIDAFRELSTCRLSSFDMGPIPFSAVVEYANIYDVGDFHEFLYFIRLMDSELLRLERAKNGSKTSSGNKSSSGHKGRSGTKASR